MMQALSGRTIALVLGAVVLSTAGQLFLKSGAQQLAGLARGAFLMGAARNAYVLAGLGAWIASTVCWLFVLRVAPLSRAYGLTSLTYVLILVASVVVFGEQVRRMHVAGTMLIVAGIVLLLSGD